MYAIRSYYDCSGKGVEFLIGAGQFFRVLAQRLVQPFQFVFLLFAVGDVIADADDFFCVAIFVADNADRP